MKNLKTGLCFFLSLLVFAACQNSQLSKDASSFTSGNTEYQFHLPDEWQTEEDYQADFNKAAIFGAADTNSISQMFIRAKSYEEQVSEEKLKQAAKEQLEKYHDELTAEPELFQADKFSGVYYKGEDLYKRKPVWIHLYYVAVGNQVVEFQFQSPKDQADKERQELFRKAVQSLTAETLSEQKSSSESEQDQSPQKAENDQLSLQVIGQKVEKQESGETALIIRYICTNKSDQAIVPAEQWNRALTAQQGDNILNVLDQSKEEEVNYLLSAGTQPLNSGKTIEAAVVYSLPDEAGTVQLIFDNGLFPEKKPLELAVNK